MAQKVESRGLFLGGSGNIFISTETFYVVGMDHSDHFDGEKVAHISPPFMNTWVVTAKL